MKIAKANGKRTDFERVRTVLEYLEEHWRERPTLAEIAEVVGLTEHHFQRLFRRWAGVSPKQFLQCVTLEHARELVRRSSSLLDATYDLGLSGPGRLHDLFVTIEAMTPGEFKKQGDGLRIGYGVHDSPFGRCVVALTARGICGLAFEEADGADELAAMRASWPRANFAPAPAETERVVERIFARREEGHTESLRLLVGGTNFQLKVWEALVRIPPGEAAAYGDVAAALGRPTAAHAIGQAVRANRIAWLIPCHRVIHRLGQFGGYRWGATRKRAMLGWEAARLQTSSEEERRHA